MLAQIVEAFIFFNFTMKETECDDVGWDGLGKKNP